MSKSPQEKRFTINGFTYAAQLWGQSDQFPVIALHGWLDNSASFDVLAPQLENMQCLAVDMAGHGLSDHRLGLAGYPLWSEVSAIYAIADQMGWSQFALLGHSRGAMMSLITAGVFPERITQLILLDSMVPPVVASDQVVERFTESIKETQRRIQRPLSLYNSYDDAIEARCRSRFAPVNTASSQLLASRGLREVDGKYHWHADGKIWAPSNVALSYDMVETLAKNIASHAVPVLSLLGETGLVKMAEEGSVYLQHYQQISQLLSVDEVVVDDGHFLHMETGAAMVAKLVNDFLLPNVIKPKEAARI
jgi:pimeloyl-ACP methyl ester carboxylesterase